MIRHPFLLFFLVAAPLHAQWAVLEDDPRLRNPARLYEVFSKEDWQKSNFATEADLQWFRDAKYGMFLHFGLSTFKNAELSWGVCGERKAPDTGSGSYPTAEWMAWKDEFRLPDFNAEKLVRHAQKAGIKFGIDFSQRDWVFPGYDPTDFTGERHQRYIQYQFDAVHELCTNYGKVDVFWFDALWWGGLFQAEMWDAERLTRMIRELQPGILIDNRTTYKQDGESLRVTSPSNLHDPHCTVVELTLDEPITTVIPSVTGSSIFNDPVYGQVISETTAKRPNIVLIMVDDMGVENLSCYGSQVYQTPHIDALAASGIRFSHAHSQPICTPSRVQIMTGIYNNRNYTRFAHLDPAQITFANLLRDAGYATAIGGKWQLKGDYEGVRNFGFGRHCLWQLNRRPSRYPNPGLEIDGEQKDFKNGEFGPDIINAYLRDFIRAQKDKDQPFLVYYPMNLPHWPFVPTPDHSDYDPEMWRDLTEEPRGVFMTQKYWDAFVRYTDKMVGQLVATLEETGQRDNTLIIWTADNGTHYDIVSEFQGRPYKGGKGSTKDSGTHVGFIASWPGVIQPGQTSDALVDFADVLPTLTDAAGIPTPDGIDGVSLLPVFQGKPEARKKDAIYCWYEQSGRRAKASEHTRDHRHKLYANGKFFDTVADPEETQNLAANGVPADLAATHAKLKAVLDHHRAVTKQIDASLLEKDIQ